MSNDWFMVVNQHTGATRYARVSKAESLTDDKYSRMLLPKEYEVADTPTDKPHTLDRLTFNLNYKRVSK